jgi:hypothetical protein
MRYRDNVEVGLDSYMPNPEAKIVVFEGSLERKVIELL